MRVRHKFYGYEGDAFQLGVGSLDDWPAKFLDDVKGRTLLTSADLDIEKKSPTGLMWVDDPSGHVKHAHVVETEVGGWVVVLDDRGANDRPWVHYYIEYDFRLGYEDVGQAESTVAPATKPKEDSWLISTVEGNKMPKIEDERAAADEILLASLDCPITVSVRKCEADDPQAWLQAARIQCAIDRDYLTTGEYGAGILSFNLTPVGRLRRGYLKEQRAKVGV